MNFKKTMMLTLLVASVSAHTMITAVNPNLVMPGTVDPVRAAVAEMGAKLENGVIARGAGFISGGATQAGVPVVAESSVGLGARALAFMPKHPAAVLVGLPVVAIAGALGLGTALNEVQETETVVEPVVVAQPEAAVIVEKNFLESIQTGFNDVVTQYPYALPVTAGTIVVAAVGYGVYQYLKKEDVKKS